MTYKTKRKEEIIKYFLSRKEESLSIKELCDVLAKDGEGESSVYRIVASLCKSGVIRKITDQKSRHCKYQYVGGGACTNHLHLKCNSCGKLIHLDCEKSKELKESVLSLGAFKLDSKAFLFGECLTCAQAGNH